MPGGAAPVTSIAASRETRAQSLPMKKKRRSWRLLRSVPILLVLETIACQQAAQDSGHVQHIEDGLLTATVIRGQTSPMKLTDRMTHYGVPGVSIAIINNGKI